MATVYSNALGLFNLTLKATPLAADLVPLGDTAVTGVPLKQTTVGAIVAMAEAGSVVNVTASTQAMAINTTYYVNYTGGACTLTLPVAATAPQGSYVDIRGGEANTAGFIIGQLALQTIRLGANLTTAGVSGSLTTPGAFDRLLISCDATSGGLTWRVDAATTVGSVAIN